MMKQVLLCSGIFVLTLGLSSCTSPQGIPNQEEGVQEKIPFQIQTQKISDINKNITQEKTAIVHASSTLVLSSKISGDITSLSAKEGDTVGKGRVIAKISDNIYGYNLALKSAAANLKAQKLQKNTSNYTLDQNIITAKSSYQKAQESVSSIQGNTNIQYDALVQKNKDTIASYNEAYQTYLQGLEQQMTQYLHEGDKILGMTENYERKNDAWEDYLGIYNGAGRSIAMQEWDTLYAERGKIRSIIEANKGLQDGDIDTKIAELESGYNQLSKYVESMVSMIQNNQIGYGLSVQQQQVWTSTWNGIQNGVQASEASFKGWKAKILPFMTNYKRREEATRLATIRINRPLSPEELAKITNDPELELLYKQTLLSLQNTDNQAKIGLEQAEKSLENTKKIKQATLEQLQSNIDRAQIALQQAQYNANKLSIRAPMKGVITKILVEKGQSINAGTPIAEFASNTPEIQLDIAPSLARMIQIGDSLGVTIAGKTLTGTVTARSLVAGKNLLSSLRISIPNNTDLIGKTAIVHFSENLLEQSKKSILLPLTAVQIISENEGEITIFTPQKTLKKQNVALGRIFGKNIEVITQLPEDTVLVISNTNNFDSKKFELSVQ